MTMAMELPQRWPGISIKIDADKAKELLAINGVNRPVRDSIVDRYARDMYAGRWGWSNDAIVICRRDGLSDVLLNGQHRLTAVVRCGVAQDFLVAFTDNPRTIEHLDSGIPRTYVDVLRLRGADNAVQLAGAAKLLWRWFYDPQYVPGNDGSVHRQLSISNDDLDTVIASTKGALEKSVQRSKDLRRKYPLRALSASVLAVTDYLLSSSDAEDAYLFWSALVDPSHLAARHPIGQLHDQLATDLEIGDRRRKWPTRTQVAKVIKTWNLWRTGESPAKLIFKAGDRFPEVQ